MKHSIRNRLTLTLISLTALVLMTIWIINNWCLEGFYINNKLNTMERAYSQLDTLVLESGSQSDSLFEDEQPDLPGYDIYEEDTLGWAMTKIRDESNISSAIIDSATGKVLLSSVRDGNFMAEKVQKYILGRNKEPFNILRETENYTVQRAYDFRTKSSYLESWGYFSDNRTIFIMSTPLAGIRESVDLSNRFLAYVGLAALICISVVMYFTSRKITSPILNLAKLSEKMSNLDFEAKYTGDAQDEIGILGHSMNVLSDKLKDTIGELKSANNELQKDIEAKIQIDEMRKDFIANVSHELKTPIALIQGYAEGLSEGMCEDKESRDYYCEVIVDEANKMNKMVRQLLTLTALEFGNDAPAMERFDLTDLIQGVVSAARILIQQKEAKVWFAQTEPVYVWADEFKIEEVVTNYLNNALNHVNGEKQIRITIEQFSREVRVSVYNTGDPIPEEDLPNLWTKFYKVDKARTREYGGSGIGLSIVKAIMDSHHKECGVANIKGGVAFWFTLDSGSS